MVDRQQKREFVLNNPAIQKTMAADSNTYHPYNCEFQSTLAPEFRFKPGEEELIIHYLDNKLQNQYNPQDLTDMHQPYGKNEWYFFTPRDRKYPKGERPKRSTIDGYWKATGADTKVMKLDDKKEIGHKKTLVYYKGEARGGVKTDWIMREYRVDASKKEKGSKLLDDVVLCRLHKKIAKTYSKRKQKKVASKQD